MIWKFYQFSWQEILQSAHKKAGFENEELLVRLKSFPKNLLDEIKIIDKEFLKDFNSEFLEIILEIEQQFI